LKKRSVDVIGLMIGDVVTEADREYKKDIDLYIKENGLDNDIYAPGFRRDIADILAATDCVVVPSSEGLGLVAMEAMSARTHVVGMDLGGSKEVLQAAGCGEIFSPDGTEENVADAVLRVMKQGEKELENGYSFCEVHNNENYSKGVHEVFSSILFRP
jgi:glycosyltransferase involved in cell wall biosynthesis